VSHFYIEYVESPGGLTGVRNMNGKGLDITQHLKRIVLQEAISCKPAGQGGEWDGIYPWVNTFRGQTRDELYNDSVLLIFICLFFPHVDK